MIHTRHWLTILRHEVWTWTTPLGCQVFYLEPSFHDGKVVSLFPRSIVTQRNYSLTYFKIGAIAGSFFGVSIMLTKLSILTLFLRFVFGKLRIVIHVIMVIIVLCTLVASFDWVYSCRPLQKYWDISITEGSCIYRLKIPIINCVMNTATDVAILILPALILRNLHLPTKQKIGIILVFMTGGLYVLHLAGLCTWARADTWISVLVITIIKLKLTLEMTSKMDITWEIITSNMWW